MKKMSMIMTMPLRTKKLVHKNVHCHPLNLTQLLSQPINPSLPVDVEILKPRLSVNHGQQPSFHHCVKHGRI